MSILGSIKSSIFSFDGSILVQSLKGLVGVAFLYFILRYALGLREGHAERSEINRGGGTSRKLRVNLQITKRQQRKNKAEEQLELGEAENQENKEAATEEADSGKKDPTVKKAKKVLKKAEKAVEAEEKAEEEITEEEETLTAAVASINGATDDIVESIKEIKAAETVEEQEEIKIIALNKSLKSINKFSKIDQLTARFFYKKFEGLNILIMDQVKYEKSKDSAHKNIIKNNKIHFKHLKLMIQELRKSLNRLNNMRKKERKSFEKELTALKEMINAKKRQIKSEKDKGSGADPNLIAQLEKEIVILEKNAKQLNNLNETLKATFEEINKEIGKLKEFRAKLFKGVREILSKHQRKLEKREKTIKRRFDKFVRKQESLSKSIEGFKDGNKIHGSILSVSDKLNKYFLDYGELIKSDLEFENVLPLLISSYYLTEKNMANYILMLSSLEESEKAVEEGTIAVIQLISVVFTEDVSGSLKSLSKTIRKNEALIDYKEKVIKYLAAVDQEIEKKTIAANEEIKELIKHDEELLAKNQVTHQKEQENLGKNTATMVNRKAAIDQTYLSKVSTLEKGLKQRNQDAAKKYQKALAA
jgi:hypothetical protein